MVFRSWLAIAGAVAVCAACVPAPDDTRNSDCTENCGNSPADGGLGTDAGHFDAGFDAGQLMCLSPLTACGETCVDIANDPIHCGSCSHVCAGSEVCTADNCVTLPSTCPANGCPTGSYCDSSNVCVAGCETDSSCATNQICQSNSCQLGCRTNNACQGGDICVQLMCVPSCQSDEMCALGEECDLETQLCISGCTSDSRCPTGQVCNNGSCMVGCHDSSGGSCTLVTVAQAISMATTPQVLEIDGAVVVAVAEKEGASGTSALFYVQDTSGGPGLAIYHGTTDLSVIPNVGDVVDVQGWIETYDGMFEINSSITNAVTLSVTVTASGTGRAESGAYSPAGQPTRITVSSFTQYSHTNIGAHPEQVGTALRFAGPLTVTTLAPVGFMDTGLDGGASHTEGFEVTSANGGALWVNDSYVYSECLRPLDGGTPDLSNGIVGVWDRYQDYGGGPEAPVYPVLVPTGCGDLNP